VKKTKEGLADGTVDIVIGTHALLAKVSSSSASALIVDEEQHFGSPTRSAEGPARRRPRFDPDRHSTPRTLQMAMSGFASCP
jgi:transcription-repair coupling factor (superfamily II helicase)